MEAQETRAAVLTNNSLSSNVQMVGRRGWGQEGTYRAGMRISIKLDISSSLGLPTLYFPRVWSRAVILILILSALSIYMIDISFFHVNKMSWT